MKNILSPEFHDFISEGRRAFAMLATAFASGTPINAPVWFLMDDEDEHILITTSKQSIKYENLQARPTQLSIVLMHEGDHLRYVLIQGEVVESEPATKEFRDRLYRKYTGKNAKQSLHQDEVVFTIKPTNVSTFGY
ncbi:MAG: pyridoxamine 5'-phosphate oxidase family protein [Aggregatilineales bacterium]